VSLSLCLCVSVSVSLRHSFSVRSHLVRVFVKFIRSEGTPSSRPHHALITVSLILTHPRPLIPSSPHPLILSSPHPLVPST
jgi:hypothetical protein